MADVMPDYIVSQQRLRWEIAQLVARIEGRKLELLELVSRRNQTLANWDAEEEAIAKKKSDLESLEKAHGPITDQTIQEAKTTNLTEALNG